MNEEKLPVAAEVYKIIKLQIVSLQLMPGQLLMVQQLSKDIGVSRTPVREALVVLKDEGLVVETDGRKFRVSEITWKLISDIFQARKTVECLAATHAAENAKDLVQQIGELETAMKRLEDSVALQQFTEYFEADMQFHTCLFAMLDNQVISGWISRIQSHQQRIRYLTMDMSAHIGHSLKEHRDIMRFIKEEDPVNAQKAMETHLDRALQDIIQIKSSPFNLSANLIRD